VKDIYNREILDRSNNSRLHILDFSSYLEKYLWIHLNSEVCFEHTYSTIAMINFKFSEDIPIIGSLMSGDDRFNTFFEMVVKLMMTETILLKPHHVEQILIFLINIFQSLEIPDVRKCVLKYISLSLWQSLSKSKLETELSSHPQIKRHWENLLEQERELLLRSNHFQKSSEMDSTAGEETVVQFGGGKKRKKSNSKDSKNKKVSTQVESTPEEINKLVKKSWEKDWIPSLIREFLIRVETANPTADSEVDTSNSEIRSSWKENLPYLERFCEFIIDMLSQLPTRRFLHALLIDIHFLERCEQSNAFASKLSDGSNGLLKQLLSMIAHYIYFEIDNFSGKSLQANELLNDSASRLNRLQQVAFSAYSEQLRDLIFSSTGELAKVALESPLASALRALTSFRHLRSLYWGRAVNQPPEALLQPHLGSARRYLR